MAFRLSQRIVAFKIKADTVITYATSNMERLHIEQGQLDLLTAPKSELDASYILYADPNEQKPAVTARANNAVDVLDPMLTAFIDSIMSNTLNSITEDDRVNLYRPTPAHRRENVSVPESPAMFILLSQKHGLGFAQVVSGQDGKSRVRALPDGANEIEVSVWITEQGEPTPGVDNPTRVFTSKRSDFIIETLESEVGKIAVVRIRYISNRGEQGPFSIPVSYVIT